ncbi:MAG: hypothetical protein HRU19_01570 [Pseudobacteriovorax sp.]|nr:hypothetical protein [Pseudobacteriovorax sp.]
MKLLAVAAAAVVSLSSQSFAECQDTSFELVETNSEDPHSARRGTVLLSCHAGQLQLPEITSLQFVWEERGKLCVQNLNSCGNVERWKVAVEIEWKIDILDFQEAIELFNETWDGSLEITPALGVEFESISNYCKDFDSKPICI